MRLLSLFTNCDVMDLAIPEMVPLFLLHDGKVLVPYSITSSLWCGDDRLVLSSGVIFRCISKCSGVSPLAFAQLFSILPLDFALLGTPRHKYALDWNMK